MDEVILTRALRPLTSGLRVEVLQAIASLEETPEDESRYHELADRNAEGQISPEERQELEQIVTATTFLSLLRGAARDALESKAA